MLPPRPVARAARIVAALFVVILAVLVPAGSASAHATLESSDPPDGAVLATSPGVISFVFDEAVQLTATSVQVFDADGNQVDADVKGDGSTVSATVSSDLADGTYVVAWRVISADSHPVAGSITFSIGAPSAVVKPPKVETGTDPALKIALGVTAALTYLGLFLCGGLTVFVGWVLAGVRVRPAVTNWIGQVRWISAGVVFVCAALTVPLNGAYDQGLGLGGVLDGSALDPSLVGNDVVVLVLQVVGLAVALEARRWRWLPTLGALVAVASPALVGHSRATSPVPVILAADVLHLLAGAVWLGGLVGLVLTLRTLGGHGRDAAVVLARFSGLAAVALGLLTVTGTLAAWRIVDSWSAFVHTGYGRVLLVKIGVAALVAALAGWNRWRLLPRVAADGQGDDEQDARRAAALRVRTAVRAEAFLLLVVLGLTGFLVDLSPNEQAATRAPVASRVAASVVGTTKVLAVAAPGRVGRNTLTIQVQDERGEPVEGFAPPTVSVSIGDPADLAGGGVALGAITLKPVANGTYAGPVVFPKPGTWHVQVSLRASQFDNPVTVVDVDVS